MKTSNAGTQTVSAGLGLHPAQMPAMPPHPKQGMAQGGEDGKVPGRGWVRGDETRLTDGPHAPGLDIEQECVP